MAVLPVAAVARSFTAGATAVAGSLLVALILLAFFLLIAFFFAGEPRDTADVLARFGAFGGLTTRCSGGRLRYFMFIFVIPLGILRCNTWYRLRI